MAYTADVNRWRGPVEEPYRPYFYATPWHPLKIAGIILGFMIWWPIGRALLFFTLGSRRMSCWSNQDRWQNKMERMQYKMDHMRGRMERSGFGFGFGNYGGGYGNYGYGNNGNNGNNNGSTMTNGTLVVGDGYSTLDIDVTLEVLDN